ncbi:MAG: BrnA antitoxin family protein [Gemmatimonadota bacterium]|nr:BrnA antitoxin family protein [Gemmatimonadota bacterium]
MSKETTTTVKRRLGDRRRGETDWDRVDALTDQEIEAAVADDADAAPLLDEEFWKGAELVMPDGKKERVTLRLDEEVLDYFRGAGRGYQTRINAVLRAYVRQQLAGGKTGPRRRSR